MGLPVHVRIKVECVRGRWRQFVTPFSNKAAFVTRQSDYRALSRVGLTLRSPAEGATSQPNTIAIIQLGGANLRDARISKGGHKSDRENPPETETSKYIHPN